MGCCFQGVYIPEITDCDGTRQMRADERLRIGDALIGYEFIFATKTVSVLRNSFVVADASAGAFTVNLPPVSKGLTIIVKKVDAANDVTIDANAAETIDGSGTLVLDSQYDAATLVANGSEWHLVTAGTTGSTGSDGADGVNGSGLAFTYQFSSTTTDADPGSGIFRLNHASFASVTEAYIDNEDATATDVSAALDTFDDSSSLIKGHLRFVKSGAPENWALYSVSSVTDSTGYRTVSLTHVDSAGSFSDTDDVVILFTRTGDAGPHGGGVAIYYEFDTTTTDSDPGDGKLRLNNATQNTATVLRLDDVDVNGVDWTTVIQGPPGFADALNGNTGTLRLVHRDDLTKFILWDLSQVNSETGYSNVNGTVQISSSANPFSNGDPVVVHYTANGVDGEDGDPGSPGANGDDGQHGGIGFEYAFDSTITDADPGSGNLRLNNAAFASATEIYIDNLDATATDVSAALDTFDDSTSTVKGHLRLTKISAPANWAIYSVSAIADSTGYRTITVSHVDSAGSFSNTDPLSVIFSPNGDAGDDATVTHGGTDNQVLRADTNDGTSIQASNVIITDLGTIDAQHVNGTSNVGVGSSTTMQSITTATNNVALGPAALRDLTEGSANMGIGLSSLLSLTTGVQNVGVGQSTLQNITTVSNNTAVGHAALFDQTTGSHNTALGTNAGKDVSTASNCIFIGSAAGGVSSGITGDRNIGIGRQALSSVTSGIDNAGIGDLALRNITTGSSNFGLGGSVLSNSDGDVTNNTGIGALALLDLTSGTNCVGIGTSAGRDITTAVHCVFIGSQSGGGSPGITGASNIGIGGDTLFRVTTGDGNTCVGRQSGRDITTGVRNTLLGFLAGRDLTTQGTNVLIGNQAGVNSSGTSNMGIGTFSLLATSGNSNTAIGTNSGRSITSGARNTFIGNGSGFDATNQLATAENSTAIGNNTFTTASNQVVIGNDSVTETILRGTINADDTPTSDPANSGGVWNDLGDLRISNGTTHTVTSNLSFLDYRDDSDAAALPSATANATQLGLVTGTFLTNATVINGNGSGGSTSMKLDIYVTLPRDYVAGEDIALGFNVARVDAAEVSATLDLQAVENGAPSTDLVTTTAIDINAAATTDAKFTLTGTALNPGDQIRAQLTMALDDTGGSGADFNIENQYLEYER